MQGVVNKYLLGLKSWQEPDINTYYFDRYLQIETDNYSLNADTFTPKIAYVNEYTEPLISTVTISGTTNPVSGIGVNFTISTYPAGAEGFSLSKSSETTNNQGIADVQLKLGNIPAEYGVTATCPVCVPEFSSVTFTCCGKLKTDEFRQGDNRWGNIQLGTHPPHYLIRQTGCALTSVANLINFYANINPNIARTDPAILNQQMTNLNIYNNNDDVLWYRVPVITNRNIRYIGGISVDPEHTRDSLLEQIDRDLLRGLPVIIHSVRANGRDHFMLAIGRCERRYIVVDPATGVVDNYDPNNPQLILQGVHRYEPR